MTGEDILHRIVSVIEESEDCDISELPPLYDSVDVEALQALMKSGVVRVEFWHAGYRIVIADGTVTVHDPKEPDGEVLWE